MPCLHGSVEVLGGRCSVLQGNLILVLVFGPVAAYGIGVLSPRTTKKITVNNNKEGSAGIHKLRNQHRFSVFGLSVTGLSNPKIATL